MAGVALAATERLTVGVGLLPAAVRNAAIAAMEIAALARVFPGRFVPAFGHGVEDWMLQIDARPSNRVIALEEIVSAVRRLDRGETSASTAGMFTCARSSSSIRQGSRPRSWSGPPVPEDSRSPAV